MPKPIFTFAKNRRLVGGLIGALMLLTLYACGSDQPTVSPATFTATSTTLAATSSPTAATTSTATATPTTAIPTATTPSTPTAIATATEQATATSAATATAPIAATATATSAATAETGYLGVEQINSASAETLDLPFGDAYLSPNGQLIAWTDGKEICVYQTAGVKGPCGASALNLIDVNSLRWAPDSASIVFTENFFVTFRDPDIWLMNASDATTTDLTDDGVANAAVLGGASEGFIDIAPRWSHDGKQIFFIREVDLGGDIRANVFTISPTGGAARQIAQLNSDGYSTYSLDVAADNQHIIYNIQFGQANDGLWQADADGKHPKRLYGKPGPADVTIAPDGRFALGQFVDTNSAQPYATAGSRVAAIDGKEGVIDPDNLAQWSAWEPNGAGLAYIVRDSPSVKISEQKGGLYITNKPGETGRQVFAAADLIAPHRAAFWRGLDWASNNTIIALRTDDLKFVLLRLSPDQPQAPDDATPTNSP